MPAPPVTTRTQRPSTGNFTSMGKMANPSSASMAASGNSNSTVNGSSSVGGMISTPIRRSGLPVSDCVSTTSRNRASRSAPTANLSSTPPETLSLLLTADAASARKAPTITWVNLPLRSLARLGLRLRCAAVTQLGSRVAGAVGDGYGLHRGAVGADFGPHVAEFGRVEAHSDDGIAAFGARLVHEPGHRLVAALGEVLGHPLQLTAEHGLETGAELRESISRPDGEPEDLAAHALDLPTGNVIGGDDEQRTTFLPRKRRVVPAAGYRRSCRYIRRSQCQEALTWML